MTCEVNGSQLKLRRKLRRGEKDWSFGITFQALILTLITTIVHTFFLMIQFWMKQLFKPIKFLKTTGI